MFQIGDGTVVHTLTSIADIRNDSQWHYLVAVWDGHNQSLYVDGQLDNTTYLSNVTITDYHAQLLLATHLSSHYPFHGGIDEVRLSKISRTADWIQTEFNNQNNPELFAVLKPTEDYCCYIQSDGWLHNEHPQIKYSVAIIFGKIQESMKTSSELSLLALPGSHSITVLGYDTVSNRFTLENAQNIHSAFWSGIITKRKCFVIAKDVVILG